MLESYRDFMNGKTARLMELLETFFRQRPTRSLLCSNESNLEMAIEIMWFEEARCVPQLHLAMDYTKRWGEGQNGFVDILVGNSQRGRSVANPVVVMELKSVSLRSLWKARQQDPRAESHSNTDYESILKELGDAKEDQLLALKHSYYDKEKQQWQTLKVKDTLQIADAQLSKYMKIISLGQAERPRPGVLDERVLCRDGGQDELRGYVVICVGGARVICRRTAIKITKYSYEIVRE